jgi:hypothetical protein
MSKARECGDKIRNPTKADALAQSAQMRRRFAATRRTANVYHCRHCGCWHVGHQPRGRR